MLPPAAKGTRSLIGRSGQFWALALLARATSEREGEGCAKKTLARRVSAMVFHGRTIRRRHRYPQPSPQARMADLHATDGWHHPEIDRRPLATRAPILPTPAPKSLAPNQAASVSAARLALFGLRPVDRQAHHHRGAGAERGTDAHHAAVQLDQRLGDGQAQPGTVMGLGQLASTCSNGRPELFARRRARCRCRNPGCRSPRRHATPTAGP